MLRLHAQRLPAWQSAGDEQCSQLSAFQAADSRGFRCMDLLRHWLLLQLSFCMACLDAGYSAHLRGAARRFSVTPKSDVSRFRASTLRADMGSCSGLS